KLRVRLFGWRMTLTAGHGRAVGVAEEFVHRHGVVQRGPTRRRILRAARHQERAWCDERVQLVQVAPGLDHSLVSAGAWVVCGRNAGLRTLLRGVEAQIPRLPIVHVRARL